MTRYVAQQFARLRLRSGRTGSDTLPSADSTWSSWVARYPLPQHLDYIKGGLGFFGGLARGAKLVMSESGEEVFAQFITKFGREAYPAREWGEVRPSGGWLTPVYANVLAGVRTAAAVPLASLHGSDVIYIPSPSTDAAAQEAIITTLYQANPGRGVIVLVADDSAAFAMRMRTSPVRAMRIVDPYMVGATAKTFGWAVYIRQAAVADFLLSVGVDLAAAQTATTPVVRPLSDGPFVRLASVAELAVYEARTGGVKPVADVGHDTVPTAPNVIGVIEGEDPRLKNEYVVFVAHMDPLAADAADDNASGVAGVLALAEAFSAPGAHPRRSVAFVATSGAGVDFAGSNFFCGNGSGITIGCRSVVATVTLDMIGRPAGDSVTIDGVKDLELTPTPDLLLAAHPELGLHLTSDTLSYTPESDYFAFARRAVPSLYIHIGRHLTSAVPAGGKPASTDSEQEARILRLAFYVGHEIATAERPPRWSADGRSRFLGRFGSD